MVLSELQLAAGRRKSSRTVCVSLQRGAIVSEPAIQVRRKGKGTQVWTIEKLENKLVDMREHYADWKEDSEEMVRKQQDPNRKVVPKYYSYAPVFGFVCFSPV